MSPGAPVATDQRYLAMEAERLASLARDGHADPAQLLRRGIELSRLAQRIAQAGARAGLRAPG